MIDREQVAKFIDALDALQEESATLELTQEGKITFRVYPKEWWADKKWSEEKRHQYLSLLTPLVGKLEKKLDGKNIGYAGDKDNVSIRLNYVDQCKILGYKVATKTVRKEVEREPEYEEVVEEVRTAITDCDIRSGKFSESDIEVTA
jgi:hypothetical protein